MYSVWQVSYHRTSKMRSFGDQLLDRVRVGCYHYWWTYSCRLAIKVTSCLLFQCKTCVLEEDFFMYIISPELWWPHCEKSCIIPISLMERLRLQEVKPTSKCEVEMGCEPMSVWLLDSLLLMFPANLSPFVSPILGRATHSKAQSPESQMVITPPCEVKQHIFLKPPENPFPTQVQLNAFPLDSPSTGCELCLPTYLI